MVGPLSKEEGMQLVQAGSFNVPTVVLNTLPIAQGISNLYQLSLAPEDEAKQVADKAWHDGRKKAVTIVPASASGKRVAQIFLSEWAALGGKVAGQMYYDAPEQLSNQVSQLLHVDQSEMRAKSYGNDEVSPKCALFPTGVKILI